MTEPRDIDIPSSEEEPNSPDDVTFDEIFDALKNHRLLRVLESRNRFDGNFEIGAVAERIAADEYQRHLPELDEMAVISFSKQGYSRTGQRCC